MFKNRVTILVTVGVLVGIAIALQLLKTQEKEVSEAIRAIPEDAVVVMETDNYYSLIKNFNTNNQFRQEFSGLDQLKDFFKKSDYIDSLIGANSELKDLIEENKIIISGHMLANNEIEYLYVLPVNDKNSFEHIHKSIEKIIGREGNDATERQALHEGFTIYDVAFFGEGIKFSGFSFSYADGLFIFSTSKILVEGALRRLKKDYSLLKDPAFKKLMESSSAHFDANIYINYKYLPSILKNVLKTENTGFYDFISQFAVWTELDIKMKDNSFLMSGFTLSNDSTNDYLNVFKGQSAHQNDFIEALPGNTSSFIAFNLSDSKGWSEAYAEYLKKNNEYKNLDTIMERMDKKYKSIGKDKSKIFYQNINGGLATVWTNPESQDSKQDVYIVMQIRDADALHAELQSMFKLDSAIQGSVVIDEENGIKAFNFPQAKLISHLFGKPFAFVKNSWYIKYKEFLIFGESAQSLRNYLHNMRKGKRLVDDQDFEVYSKSIASESNLFIYSNVKRSRLQLTSELNEKYLGIYTKNQEKINKIEAASIQFGFDKNLISTNIFLGLNPRVKKAGKNAWEVSLDANLSMKPQIVKSNVAGNSEIVLQDNVNNLVLISETGKLIWKKKLSGKILGEINQIDFYKNNKYQFLFNTKDYIYLVDRNGKNVEDYPIKLKSPATNGMAVFDYDKDRTYRILLACENKGVYLLNTNGGKVDGWAFGQTESEVKLPAKHFTANSKDYIIFGDNNNTYIVNRKGETRVNVKAKFTKNPTSPYFFDKGASENENRFITTIPNGDIYCIYVDGTVKKISIDEFSPNHQFILADLEGNGKNQFIFADKKTLYVYNSDKSLKFEKKFEGDIVNTINLYQISKKSKYIGVSPLGSNKIYLLDTSGEIVKGFPVPGNGQFSIGRLSAGIKSNEFNLIVGNEDNYLLNYLLGTGETGN
jgi:hypothetical protein